MKKLIYLIVIIVILGLIVSGCLPSVVPPSEQGEPTSLTRLGSDTYYVATDGSDAHGDGTEIWVDNDSSTDWSPGDTGPWLTISHALSQTKVMAGDTISVAAGTYTNDIWDSGLGIPVGYRITKSVTLLGAHVGNDPAGSTDRVGETILVRTIGIPYSLYASGITIDGFTFTSGGGSGGGRLIIAGDDIKVKNCIIKDVSGTDPHGVWIAPEAENALIECNTFSNTAWEAIRCESNAVISNNTIKDIPSNKGIFLGGADGAQVIDNVITNTFYEGIQSYASVTITGNEITGCYNGIQIRGSATDSVIRNNLIVDSTYWGIDVQSDITAAVIEDNTVTGSGYCGVTIWNTGDGSGFLVNCNSFDGSGIYGVESKTTTPIDATCNWWGAHNGPNGEGPGTGDAVSINVDFDPWLGDLAIDDPITIEPNLVAQGTQIELEATFTGPPTEITATINWGDDEITIGTVSMSNGTGIVIDSHIYAEAGVYTVTLTITDYCGEFSNDIEFQYVVVYDSTAGFVTGGGWIDSPPGAYISDPTLTGPANFGFVSKYKKGQTIPTGNTEFQFKAGDLNFHSDSYDWLVIAGAKAMYKGTGTINGAGNYGFMISAVDEKLTPSTDVDLFRIKIWDKDDGDAVVYDNNIGDAEDADPTTGIAGGQIVIHKGK